MPSAHTEREEARHAIREVLMRYFLGIDSRNANMVLACFSGSASIEIGGRNYPSSALPEVFGFVRPRGGTGSPPSAVPPIGDLSVRMSTHSLTTVVIDVDPDAQEARSECYASVHLAGEGPTGEAGVVVRGLRYLDEWRRERSEWKVTRRRQFVDWMYAAPALYVAPHRER